MTIDKQGIEDKEVMGNPDKRKKRSKAKAKFTKVTQHRGLSSQNNREVFIISAENVALFKTLLPFTSAYDAVPYIKQYQNNIQNIDSEEDVAMVYVMYYFWAIFGSKTLNKSEIFNAVGLALQDPIFQEKFNSELPLLKY